MRRELSTRQNLSGGLIRRVGSYRGRVEVSTPSRPKKKNLWQLYALFPLMVGLLLLAIVIAPSLELRRALEVIIVLVVYGLMARWQRHNDDETTL
jgi:hypothetical protein